ncbi:Inactive leucine-rich repeat receptor-like serine/threonine-protein kinase At1g60630 [Linum grandiflorum]
MEPLVSIRSLLFFFIFFFFSAVVISPVRSGDSEALLALKSTIDPSNSLSSWLPPTARNVCDWEGVKQCLNGRVTKLVVEFRNLTGVLDAKILNRLDQLRVLSFKSNSISGRIPDLSGLVNLKSLFLNQNNFSGGFPESVTLLHRLKDLLKASAETLGRGTMGSTYKAVMESGFIVTVKRLKDARYPRVEEFRRQMEVIGRLRHPNLVPLRAYFQAKEERLLVYDYFPNGSLFSLLHGTRASGGGKPLHWTSCLKIAEDLATGILYIHQNPGLAHGNLKSSNVLLGPDFESCLTDFGLAGFQNPDSPDEPSAVALFYRAPEVRDVRKPPTQPSDVYSFGVLLLELLTGKTPFQDLVQEHGSDIPRWVRSVREEETDSGDDPVSSGNEAEEKLQALVGVAMLCVSRQPENRPAMREVVKMIREARSSESGGGGGGQVSSNSNNSSDHSPGRWSDTVQSLPREEHLSI